MPSHVLQCDGCAQHLFFPCIQPFQYNIVTRHAIKLIWALLRRVAATTAAAAPPHGLVSIAIGAPASTPRHISSLTHNGDRLERRSAPLRCEGLLVRTLEAAAHCAGLFMKHSLHVTTIADPASCSACPTCLPPRPSRPCLQCSMSGCCSVTPLACGDAGESFRGACAS